MSIPVAAAAANTRQRPDAANITGKSSPSCGLSVSVPIRKPATSGRLSRQANTVSKSAAVSSELWPEIRQNTIAGDSRTGSSNRRSSTVRNRAQTNIASPSAVQAPSATRYGKRPNGAAMSMRLGG